MVRFALSLTTYRKLARWIPPVRCSDANPNEIRAILWGVRIIAKLIPYASCLTQALAAQYLCSRAGYPTQIRIGVKREGTAIAAHAWLMDETGIMIGGSPAELASYTPIVDLDCVRS
jgi:hypothetical protein